MPQNTIYLRQLFIEWATLRPEESLNSLDLVPDDLHSTVINFATASLLDTLTPEEILQMFEDHKLEQANISGALQRVFTRWSEQDPKATYQWIIENTELGSVTRSFGLSRALENLALIEPQKAFELGLQEPMGEITPLFSRIGVYRDCKSCK